MGTRDELDAMGFDSDSPPPTRSKGEKQAMATRQRGMSPIPSRINPVFRHEISLTLLYFGVLAVENGALLPAW